MTVRLGLRENLQPLIDAGLVKFGVFHDCNDPKYISWHFYSPDFDHKEMVSAECFVTTHELALIKYYLKLPDGFDKKNGDYGLVKFSYKKGFYNFKYKGEKAKFDFHPEFHELVHLLWECLERDGKKYLERVPGYRNNRRFYI